MDKKREKRAREKRKKMNERVQAKEKRRAERKKEKERLKKKRKLEDEDEVRIPRAPKIDYTALISNIPKKHNQAIKQQTTDVHIKKEHEQQEKEYGSGEGSTCASDGSEGDKRENKRRRVSRKRRILVYHQTFDTQGELVCSSIVFSSHLLMCTSLTAFTGIFL